MNSAKSNKTIKQNIVTENQRTGGVKATAEILRGLAPEARTKILENVAKQDPKLADEIRKQLFIFEDLNQLDERSMQIFLREVPAKILAIALRRCPENLKTKILKGMSQTAAQVLEDEIQSMGKQRMSDVTKAQQELADIAKNLEDHGKIMRSSA